MGNYVSTSRDMELYRKRMIEFSKLDDTEKIRKLRNDGFGIVVQSYPREFEEEVYRVVAKLISKKYPKWCNKDSVFDVLTSYGNIYTMKVNHKFGYGFFDNKNTGAIGIYSYLNRISEEFLHECVHKLGFLQFDPEFYDMDPVFLEAGVESVTNIILEKPECRECILPGLWVRNNDDDSEYLIQTTLVNQLNALIGGNTLEKSILTGKNIFEKRLIEVFGKAGVDSIKARIENLLEYEKQYWRMYKKSGNNRLTQSKIIDLFNEFQDSTMRQVFDKKIAEAETSEQAELVLAHMLKYSEYRLKEKEVKETDQGRFRRYKDISFEQYYKECTEKLVSRFGKVNFREYDEKLWENKYPVILSNERKRDRKKEEREDIDFKAKNYRRHRPKIFARAKSHVVDDSVPIRMKSKSRVENIDPPGFVNKFTLDFNSVSKFDNLTEKEIEESQDVK